MEITKNTSGSDFDVDVPKKEKIVYDPNKRYRWPSEASFDLVGGEFGVILNSLRQILSTKEAQGILQAARASEIMETALKTAVESGIAIEDQTKN